MQPLCIQSTTLLLSYCTPYYTCVCFYLILYASINSYGHAETFGSPNRVLFSWASLTKRLTSTSVHAHTFACNSCADPEGGGDRGSRPPMKNLKNIGFPSNTGPDPLKNRSYQASIQCWAIVGMPAKPHLMEFR